jgi:hypothetical protein
MYRFNTNVVIHIDEQLSRQEIQDMEKSISFDLGVTSACVHERTPHLMVVDYDPNVTSGGELLRGVRNRGVHAELIGGI